MAMHVSRRKGRVCFRGDWVTDENGAAAFIQELSAPPTSIHSANIHLCYGAMPGKKRIQADAIRAYVQSDSKSIHPTWVVVPPEFWPRDWKDKFPDLSLSLSSLS
eukprot:2130553-Karenia_brevis.AAC.1